jgi:AcrR family transcriptional regulator
MPRQKSAQAHRRVLETAANLFADRGIDATSMDAIADESGVSKATIYKHWPDKESLCLEVLAYIHGLDERPPVFDSGDLRADIIAQLRFDPGADRKTMKDRVWPHLVAYSARNRKFGDAWRMRVLGPARKAFTEIIQRGQKRGFLASRIDTEIALALLVGPIVYRNAFSRLGAGALNNLEPAIADAFLGAFGIPETKIPAYGKQSSRR